MKNIIFIFNFFQKLYKSERNNRAKKRLLDDSALETDPKCSRYSKDLPHISESTSSLSLSSHQKIDKYTNTDDDLDTELGKMCYFSWNIFVLL